MNTLGKKYYIAIIFTLVLITASCSSPTSTPVIPAPTNEITSTTIPTETQIPPTKTPVPPTFTPTPNITSTPNPTLVAIFISGLWEGSNGSFYLFSPDGIWHWDEHLDRVTNKPENTGKWFIRGDTFYIQDLTGKGKCPEKQVGSYEPSFENGKLKLIVISDKCEVRVPQTQGIYTLIP